MRNRVPRPVRAGQSGVGEYSRRTRFGKKRRVPSDRNPRRRCRGFFPSASHCQFGDGRRALRRPGPWAGGALPPRLWRAALMMRLITNPMINKELRQRLRERRAWLLPTLYLLILSGTALFAYYLTTDAQMQGGRREVQGADIGLAIFLTLVFTQIIALLLMAPVFSAGSITIEKEQRTLA